MAAENSQARADRVWQRFIEMFGARFAEQFGPKPSASWVEACGELDNAQIKGALTKIRNSGSPHPPSLPEFVAYAKCIRVPGRVESDIGPSDEQQREYAEQLKRKCDLLRTMPKGWDGGVSNPFSTPPQYRAAYLAEWEAWEAKYGPAPWRSAGIPARAEVEPTIPRINHPSTMHRVSVGPLGSERRMCEENDA